MVKKELCVENFTRVQAGLDLGVDNIELCDNLAVGGTTPSYGVIRQTLARARAYPTQVNVLVRPRAGDFCYSQAELEIMLEDVRVSSQLGAHGIVIGALKDGWIHEGQVQALLEANTCPQVTFHMAFDALDRDRQFAAIDWLADRGVHRILSHGGPAGTDIFDNVGHLQALLAHAGDRITILLGGGVTHHNLPALLAQVPAREVHGTRILDLEESLDSSKSIGG